MVGIVPGSAKLMELAGLFSGKARSLLGRGIGSLAAQDVLVAPCRGNAYPSQGFGLRSLAPGVRVYRGCHISTSYLSRHLARFGISENPAHHDLRIGSETDLSVILKSWGNSRS